MKINQSQSKKNEDSESEDEQIINASFNHSRSALQKSGKTTPKVL